MKTLCEKSNFISVNITINCLQIKTFTALTLFLLFLITLVLIRNEELGIKNWDTVLVEVTTSDFETLDPAFHHFSGAKRFFWSAEGCRFITFYLVRLGEVLFLLT